MGSSRLTSGPEFSPLPLTLYHVKDTAAPKLASHRLSPLAAGELGKPVVGTGGGFGKRKMKREKALLQVSRKGPR